jgi:hypothetical protein
MALIDYINLGYDLQIIVADTDPRISGIDVPQGSLVLLNDGSASFFKSGTLSTDWSLSVLGSGTTQSVPVWTSSGILGNSKILYDNATSNITIGDGITGANTIQSASENRALRYSSATNTVIEGFKVESATSGTPAVGIGTSIPFATETSTVATKIGSVLSSITTNVGTGTEAFDFSVSNMTGGATATERMRIKSTGQIQLNAYTSVSSFSGTPVASLMTNSTGNIVSAEPVLQATLTASATGVNGAFTTPITLVSAQGAGRVIVPSALIFRLTSAGTAFATNTNYQFQIGTTAIGASRSFAGTTSIFTLEPITALASTAVANLQNQPLVWKVLVGNSTGGTGASISIGCIYSVMTI